jgi:predicted HTH domain antitoxin
MEITVKLPDDLAQHQNPGREALEALVLQGYCSGVFSNYQAAQLLGFSRLEFEELLKRHRIGENAYGVEDLQQDDANLRSFENKLSRQQ